MEEIQKQTDGEREPPSDRAELLSDSLLRPDKSRPPDWLLLRTVNVMSAWRIPAAALGYG